MSRSRDSDWRQSAATTVRTRLDDGHRHLRCGHSGRRVNTLWPQPAARAIAVTATAAGAGDCRARRLMRRELVTDGDRIKVRSRVEDTVAPQRRMCCVRAARHGGLWHTGLRIVLNDGRSLWPPRTASTIQATAWNRIRPAGQTPTPCADGASSVFNPRPPGPASVLVRQSWECPARRRRTRPLLQRRHPTPTAATARSSGSRSKVTPSRPAVSTSAPRSCGPPTGSAG